MSPRYFDLSDNEYAPRRWYLNEPMDEQGHEVNPWRFTKGQPVHVEGRLKLPINVQGKPLEFTTTTLASTPIVHARVAPLLTALAPDDVQLVPVSIHQHPGDYFLVNVTRLIKCIDDARCLEVRYFRPEDGQPAKVGTYKSVLGLRIDPSLVGEARLFRPWGWEVALIVREDIKQALERAGVTGTHFQEV